MAGFRRAWKSTSTNWLSSASINMFSPLSYWIWIVAAASITANVQRCHGRDQEA
jgi:hypothetical protein